MCLLKSRYCFYLVRRSYFFSYASLAHKYFFQCDFHHWFVLHCFVRFNKPACMWLQQKCAVKAVENSQQRQKDVLYQFCFPKAVELLLKRKLLPQLDLASETKQEAHVISQVKLCILQQCQCKSQTYSCKALKKGEYSISTLSSTTAYRTFFTACLIFLLGSYVPRTQFITCLLSCTGGRVQQFVWFHIYPAYDIFTVRRGSNSFLADNFVNSRLLEYTTQIQKILMIAMSSLPSPQNLPSQYLGKAWLLC